MDKIRNLALQLWNNKKLFFACVGALAAVILIVSVSAAVVNDPMNQVQAAWENSAKAYTKNDTVKDATDFLSGGSLELSGNLEKLTESAMGFPLDMDASAKIYIDASKMAAAAEAKVSMEGSEILDGVVYISDEDIAVASEALLGKTAYGVDLTKLAKNLENSVFGEDGAYALGIDEEMLAEMQKTLEGQEDMQKDLLKIVADLTKTLKKSVKDHAEFVRGKDEIKFGDKTVKTKTIAVVLDGEAIAEIAEDVLMYAEKNSRIEKFINKYAYLLAADMGMDEDEFADMFYEGIDDLLDSVDDLEDAMEDAQAELLFHISRSGKEIIGAELTLEADGGGDVKLSLICGPTWKELTEITLKVDDGYSKNSISFEVKENTGKVYEALFRVKEDTYVAAEAKVEWDKKEGDLKLSISSDGDEVTLRGNLQTKRNTWILVLESVSMDDEKVSLGDITLTLRTSDKMPAVKKYEDILTMDEDELEDLIADLQETAQELVSSLIY